MANRLLRCSGCHCQTVYCLVCAVRKRSCLRCQCLDNVLPCSCNQSMCCHIYAIRQCTAIFMQSDNVLSCVCHQTMFMPSDNVLPCSCNQTMCCHVHAVRQCTTMFMPSDNVLPCSCHQTMCCHVCAIRQCSCHQTMYYHVCGVRQCAVMCELTVFMRSDNVLQKNPCRTTTLINGNPP